MPSKSQMQIPLFIEHDQQGTYFTLPFTMPDNIESFTLTYHYKRHQHNENQVDNGSFISRKEINIIDLGLIAPDGKQVGASGSDKSEIFISETRATPGYHPCTLVPGEWQIIVGAYKVADEGVSVLYELSFITKYLRLFKGDLHTHTFASDGVLSIEELTQHALRNGLDYIAITDHNQMVSTDSLLEHAHLTLIPGIEWTHYQGHANFLGVDRPYDEPFLANSIEEVQARFTSAHARGALIVINHPFHDSTPFKFDLNSLHFDCLEVWTGPMLEYNLRAIGFWQSLLVAGKKIPICGGSDYHGDSLLRFPGVPTTCVYSMSASSADIISGLRQGHAYITFDPSGPGLEMTAGDAILGDSVEFSKVKQVKYTISGLLAGDVVQMVTELGNTLLVKAETDGEMHGIYSKKAAGFARIEILRDFLPGLPLLPTLIANPIYFDA